MKQAQSTILAVGAAGKFAGLVLPALAQRGAKVRGLIRRASDAERVRAHGATDVAVGDLEDRASVNAALDGIDSVFYIAPAFFPTKRASASAWSKPRSGLGCAGSFFRPSFIRHSLRSRITPPKARSNRRFWRRGWSTRSSTRHCSFRTTPAVGRGCSRPACWPSLGPPRRFGRVDYRDVAEVAAIALTEDRLTFGTFELCAEGTLNRKEVAALIGDVLGRPIDAAKVQLDTSTALPADSPEGRQLTAMKPMFDWYDRHSLLGNALTLRAILGREPRTLRAYFEELAGAA